MLKIFTVTNADDDDDDDGPMLVCRLEEEDVQ